MKQISQTDLAIHIHVVLTCMPKRESSAGGWRGEQAVKAATAKIMELFSGVVVLSPDDVAVPGSCFTSPSQKRGEFGITEPWPFEPGCRPPMVPCPPGMNDAG